MGEFVMAIPTRLFDHRPRTIAVIENEIKELEAKHAALEQNMRYWRRGFDAGVMTGTIITTLLLGGGIAFVIFIDWLGKCA